MIKSRGIFFRFLIPLVVVTLSCSLFSSPLEEPTAEVILEPTSVQSSDMPEPTLPQVPAQSVPTNTLVPATLTPTVVFPDTSDVTPTPESRGAFTLEPVFHWIPEMAYKSQSSGYFVNLKIDSRDELHLGFFQDTNDIVWWMQGQSNKWATQEQVTGGSGRGFHVSMVLDSKDNPHFAYHSRDTKKQEPFLYYKYWKGDSWMGVYKNTQYRVVDTDISLALGPDDEPHFAFLEDYGQNLIYATFGSSGFVNQVVGRANLDVKALPLVIDYSGDPHLVYLSVDQGLVYATQHDENWRWEVVDANIEAGLYSDITIDHAGILHIAYYDQGSLKYASRSGDGWETQLVDAQGDVGQYPSIVVDSAGNIHISYYDATNETLKYAYGTADGWAVDTVDDLGSVGEYTSIALDSKGMPYIAYHDSDNSDLKLARAMPLSP